MKKLFFNIYVFAFLFIGDYVMFAQPGTGGDGNGSSSDDGDGTNEGGDAPVSINGKTIILAITAISFAFYYFNKLKEEKQYSN